jgi:hypothetical protein
MVKRARLLIPLLLALPLSAALFLGGCSGGTDTTSTTPSTSTPTTSEATTTSTSAATTSTTTAKTSTTATPAAGEERTYTAQLSGSEMVPPVSTEATGVASFTVDATGTHVRFSLSVSNLTDPDSSRVHQGAQGSTGPGVVILLSGRFGEGVFTGTVASGSFDASAFIGPLKGKTIADFVALIESGQAYVSVGTVTNPGGEIRGQIR